MKVQRVASFPADGDSMICARCIVEHHSANLEVHTSEGIGAPCDNCADAITMLDGDALCRFHVMIDIPLNLQRY